MFLNALSRNPLVPFSYDGYQKGYWYNYTKTQSGSIQGYDINVYGNDLSGARLSASYLAGYLKKQLPITDISVGIAQRGNQIVIKVLYGKNLHRGSFAPKKKPTPPVGNKGAFNKAFDQGYDK